MYPKYQIIITSTCNQYKILRFLQCMCVCVYCFQKSVYFTLPVHLNLSRQISIAQMLYGAHS